MIRYFWFIVSIFYTIHPMLAYEESYDTRAIALYREFRCRVCEGQTIAESNATLAKDLRSHISKLLAEGYGDEEIKRKLVEHYGEDILMQTPLAFHTLLLWLIPIISLGVGMGTLFVIIRQQQRNN